MTANLITPTGHFDPQAIAARVNALWSAKQDFLSGYQGPTLRYWQDNIWTGALEMVLARQGRRSFRRSRS